MIDIGLTTGAKSLWEDHLLFDYTIKVGKYEFKVHKVVLASISDYFRAMLGGSMRESTTDRVVLKGLSAHGVSKTIDVIYTGDEEIVAAHAAEILKCAVYFQIPKLVEACTDRLLHDINPQNCCQLLSMFVMFSLQKEIKKVMKFMMHNWEAVSHCLNPKEVSLELVQVFLNHWETLECELFHFIKTWIEADYKKRNAHVNNLMSQVRFCLVGAEYLTAIRKMNIYTIKSDDDWCQLVNEAHDYQKLPMYQKVLVHSKQNEVRSHPRPIIIPIDYTIPPIILDKGETHWEEIEYLKVCPSMSREPVVIEVNNFLILNVLPEDEEDYKYWCIFDPRRHEWSQIASTVDKFYFGLVYHNDHLYQLGGTLLDLLLMEGADGFWVREMTDDVLEYSFKTNTWRTISKTPAAVRGQGTCVLGDHIYVSGGGRKAGESLCRVTADMDCYDILTSTWHKKAPMSHARELHQMGVIKLHNEEVILVIDNKLRMEYYTPVTNQWSLFKHTFSSKVLRPSQRALEGAVIFKGNSVFILDEPGNYEESGHQYDRACVRWDFSDEDIQEVQFPHYGPLEDDQMAFGVLVSIVHLCLPEVK